MYLLKEVDVTSDRRLLR